MKKTYLLILGFIVLGCQKAPQSTDSLRRASLKRQARAILGQMSGSVSQAYSGRQASRGAYADYSLPHSTAGMRMDIMAEIADCTDAVQSIAKVATNYLPMIATLTQCLDLALHARNPIFTYAFRNMDPQTQKLWSYLMNWRKPGPLSSSSLGGGYNDPFAEFGPNGFVGRDY